MCHGGRLLADFVAGTDARPDLPEVLEQHLTPTTDGLWVVWAYKLARPTGNRFVPMTGGPGYAADATAECRARRFRRSHSAPDPECTCGFHAVSCRMLSGLHAGHDWTELTVALSGRVLALEWADGLAGAVLWRAERQTVVRIEEPTLMHRTVRILGEQAVPEGGRGRRNYPGDPDGRPAIVHPAPPRDSGPIRLDLPVTCPAVQLSEDDAGWCVTSRTFERSPGSLVLT
jgi:hypothetical protein